MTRGRDDDAEQQDRLLSLARRGPLLVHRLYLLADPRRWDEASLGRIVGNARRQGLAVYAVPPGELQNAWARPFVRKGWCDAEPVLEWLREVIAFNDGNPGAGFVGVQLDIEPHAAEVPRWLWGTRRAWLDGKGGLLDERNQALAREYLTLLEMVREEIRKAGVGLILAATAPAWFAKEGDEEESYELRHRGVTAPLARHIRDRVDFVSVMAYRDGGSRESWDLLVADLRPWVESGPTEALLETQKPRRSGPSKSETLYRGGEELLLRVETYLRGQLGDRPAYLGVGIHQYRNAYASGDRGWPDHEE